MAFENEQLRGNGSHRVILEDRRQLCVTGVEEVESFDENTIALETDKGFLIVRGEELHIEQLSLDGGELRVDGLVDSITYEESSGTRSGFLSRFFR